MDFETAMLKCNTAMDESPLWEVLKKAYNENIHVPTEGQKVGRIPKILHQFWHGGPFPEKYKQLTDKWLKLHPDWSYILWDEAKVAEFGLANKWMYDNMVNPSAKSDVVRYEVVYSYGGVYVDTDFLVCKNLDDLLYLDMFSGMVGTYDGRLTGPDCILPSIFGASQGNKTLEKIIIKIGQQTVVPRTVPEIMTITGPDMFSKTVLEELPNSPKSIVFPPNYLYSFPGARRESIRNLSLEETESALARYVYPETYAMHLWYCSWQKSHLL